MEPLVLTDRLILARTDLAMTAEARGHVSPAAVERTAQDWALPGDLWALRQFLRHWAAAWRP